MKSLRQYLISHDAQMELATVKYRRSDGRYAVDVKGKTRIVGASVASLAPGRRVAVSKVLGKWFVTDDLKSFENTNTTRVIVNA